MRVLDVAAGAGNAALAAADAGADVVAADLTPELFAAGRAAAAERGVEVTWREADAEALPFADAAFDVVMPCVGVMFAPHHQQAADELVRVCRPGATIGLLNWTPDGFIGQMFALTKPYAAPPDERRPGRLTGTTVRDSLNGRVTPWMLGGIADDPRETRDGSAWIPFWSTLICGPGWHSRRITVVAGILEGLILIPVPGQAGLLPPDIPAVALAIEGTHLIPLTDAVRSRFQKEDHDDTGKVEGFYELTQGVARWTRELSGGWMVLYAHCEFFGGDGIHAAIAWHQESIIFGPCFTRTRGEVADPPYQAAVVRDMAINAGLRALGIYAVGRHDELANIGLDKHRWTNDWLTE
jgi:Methyltransferase domain